MRQIPIALSKAHLHPTNELVYQLFGISTLPIKRSLHIPELGWVSTLRATILGAHGKQISIAILGPPRAAAQLEMSPSQYRALGIRAPYRQSGALENTPGFTVQGTKDRILIPRGAIISNYHIHVPTSWGIELPSLPVSAYGFDNRWIWHADIPVKPGEHAEAAIHFDYEIGSFLFGEEKTAFLEETAWLPK